MDLERRIGQLLLVGFRGFDLDEAKPFLEQVRAGQVGGVVLFEHDWGYDEPRRNIRSPEQVRALVEGLQDEAPEALFVGIDQEGGAVNRLKERYGFPPALSQAELAGIGVEATRTQGRRTAATLRQLGINLNFAPVVDVAVDPHSPAIGALGRSFSADPRVVTEHARALVESHRAERVLTALKHFPGHGSAGADSHLGLVDVTTTWSEVELVPYQDLIGEGLVDMVMTAHVSHRGLDPDWPATLSPAVVGGLLRGRLGFSGVVVSDDLQMGAIASRYGLETALRRTLLAGIDLLMFANNNGRAYEADIAPRAVQAIVSLVEEGTIDAARIDEAAERVGALKRRLA